MSESSRTSGVFIRPRWRREPNDFEKLMAFVMTIVPVVGLILCTFDAKNQAPKVKAAAEQIQNSARSLGLLSASDGGARPAAEPGLASRYSEGRRMMAESFASLGRDLRADRDVGEALPWVGAAVLGVLGIIFCFFGWPMRRYASALYGAAWLGYVAFVLAIKLGGMQPLAAGLVALAPAFLGALIGWHLVVAMSCVFVATLICVPAAWAFLRVTGSMPAWFAPAAISAWALLAGLAYIFLVRAALISAMAVGGGLAVAMAAATLLVAWKDLVMPWEAILAIIAFFAIVGNLTQYRFAGGGKDGGKGEDAGDADAGAKKKPKLKPA
jgi:hypothetical protein